MSTISSMDNLKLKIEKLETLQLQQLEELKNSALELVKSVSPVQLIKNTLREVMTSPGLKTNAMDAAVGIGAGMLAKKIFVNSSGNIFKKITGSALQFILTNFVSKKMHQTRKQAIPQMEEGNGSHI